MRTFIIWLLSCSLAFASPASLGFPGPGGIAGNPVLAAPISLGTAQAASGASTITINTTAAIPAGALVVVAIGILKSTSISVSTVSDGTNSYGLARTSTWDANTFETVEVWYKANASAVGSGASLVVTPSATTSNGDSFASAFYIPGGNPTSPLDKVNSGSTGATPTSTPASGTTGTLTQANEIAIGVVGGYNSTSGVAMVWTESTGFTLHSNQAGSTNVRYNLHVGYQIVSATTALNYQPTSTSGTMLGAAVITTFKGY